jgi:hypothetical protein
MPSSGMCRSVAIIRADVWKKPIASTMRMERIGKLGIALTVKDILHSTVVKISNLT